MYFMSSPLELSVRNVRVTSLLSAEPIAQYEEIHLRKNPHGKTD